MPMLYFLFFSVWILTLAIIHFSAVLGDHRKVKDITDTDSKAGAFFVTT